MVLLNKNNFLTWCNSLKYINRFTYKGWTYANDFVYLENDHKTIVMVFKVYELLNPRLKYGVEIIHEDNMPEEFIRRKIHSFIDILIKK